MQLSVIIVNYNVRLFLENMLVSLDKAMQGIGGEVVVVDNASDDGSVDMVRSKFPDVQLIANQKNVGFAAANNLALQRAKGEYVLLINPDTVVQEDTLHTMITFFNRNPDVGLAGCKILNPDGTVQLACRRSFPTPWVAFTRIAGLSTLFPNSKLFGRYNLTYLNPDESYEVDAVSGSFMFLRREVYEHLGGLDEQFFMYGEDLDWCYRIQQAGWKIFYVHSTQIIHYKGESVKRSDLDELRLFYDAMHLFVKKHLRTPSVAHMILRVGIIFHGWLAALAKAARPAPLVAMDWSLAILSIGIAEYIYLDKFFEFPDYAYPVVYLVPGAVVALVMGSLGMYTLHRVAVRRAIGGVAISYVLLSALTFFFKDYAFSRVLVVYASIISLVLIPGWRLAGRLVFRSLGREKGILGRRTLIVGIHPTGHEVLKKLRSRVDEGYSVIGFIDMNRSRIGEKIGGVEILGSIDNIGKVIRERNVTEVIFSTDTFSYMDILSVIARSRERSVNFRLVPSGLEVIIGKTSIDQLDDIPLVEIDYNIDRPMNRFLKRLFDLVVGGLLLTTVYPFVRIRRLISANSARRPDEHILVLPQVIRGELSLVGRPISKVATPNIPRNGRGPGVPYLGKQGLTGIVQINEHEELSAEEIEKYILYYAKNQSLVLDLEILLKSFLLRFRKK